MNQPEVIDAATEAFLETAAADLRAQLGASATVHSLRVDQAGSDLELVATLNVAGELIEVRARGETLMQAYAELWQSTSMPVLVSAYRQVLNL